ncbi:MAG: zinc ABC transporter substrate-binding protein [Streptococcaceae bacterium]|jgi:zinc transport system substrate-binding protein|nr:zinc ABC transporter substrate-binding protein [Streptococcaceae bacterium]
MKKKTMRLLLFLMLPVLFVLAGCQHENTANQSQPEIVTTFEPMYEFTKAIVGDELRVTNIVPGNQEVHEFEPSAKEVSKLTDASAIVYNSDYLEKWLHSIKSKGVKIEASKPVKLIGKDPHTWVSPKEAIIEVKYISEQLSKKLPKYKAAFEKNSAAYVAKLEQLDKEFDQLKNAQNKTFITQHEAFSYLARDYGLNQINIAGLDPETEPSSATLARLKNEMEKAKLKTVYFENNSNSAIAETLAKETNAQLLVINPVEGLTNAQKKAGEDYLTIMKENLEALKKTIH